LRAEPLAARENLAAQCARKKLSLRRIFRFHGEKQVPTGAPDFGFNWLKP
jgi:hypothetical protein